MGNSIHKQKKVTLKNGSFSADIGIIPLLKWMDSFQSVRTHYSCQGSNGGDSIVQHLPYVMFSCNTKDLIHIGRKVCADCRISIECEFHCEFPSKPILKYVIRSQYVGLFRSMIRKIGKIRRQNEGKKRVRK